MAFIIDGTAGVQLSDVTSTAQFKLGQRHISSDGGEYIYVKASGAITAYDAVTIDSSFYASAATKANVDKGRLIGFAQQAFTDTYYGWVALKGVGISARLLDGSSAEVAMYTTGTSGVLGTASTSQTKIKGIVALSANSSGATAARTVMAVRPFADL